MNAMMTGASFVAVPATEACELSQTTGHMRLIVTEAGNSNGLERDAWDWPWTRKRCDLRRSKEVL